MKPCVTLYLADDHQIVIDGLKLLIGNEDDIRVIGCSNDGETACADIKDRKPDLALLDFSMPKLNGLDVIFTLRKITPDTRFIILSMYDNPRDIKAAKNGGASGYILKNTNRAELMKCLRTVLEGGSYFPDLKTELRDEDKSLFTPREVEIIKLILDEYSSAEIAVLLNLSLGTVDTHRKNINRKTGTNKPLSLSKFLVDNQIKL